MRPGLESYPSRCHAPALQHRELVENHRYPPLDETATWSHHTVTREALLARAHGTGPASGLASTAGARPTLASWRRCRWWPGTSATAAAISFHSAAKSRSRSFSSRSDPTPHGGARAGRRASGGRVRTRRAHPRCPPLSRWGRRVCMRTPTSSPHRHVPAQGYPRLGRADGE